VPPLLQEIQEGWKEAKVEWSVNNPSNVKADHRVMPSDLNQERDTASADK